MPVCVAGMHRSGTSMVTNILYLAGLYLGPEDDLFPPLPYDNPKGFWEKKRFVELNNEILQTFGGSSGNPPKLANGWYENPKLQRVEIKARELLDSFGGREPWGWKDPRNSLTLPFWTRLLPGVKVIVCIRHPYEVAESLRQRMKNTLNNRFRWFGRPAWRIYETFGAIRSAAPAYAWCLDLWREYNRSVFNHALPDQRLITHYDAYFHDPRGEIDRLLEFAGLPRSKSLIDTVSSAIAPQLRHNRHAAQKSEGNLPLDLLELYDAMCGEAGLNQRTLARSPGAVASTLT